jgi:hypothetical protein
MEEKKKTCRSSVEKPEGQTQLGRYRRKWTDILKIAVKEIAWDGVKWVYLVQHRKKWWALVNRVMNLSGS